MSKQVKKRFIALFSLVMLGTGTLLAQEAAYDPYASVWREGPLKKKPFPLKETFTAWATHFLVYPFELVRWPIGETLAFIQKYHVQDKVDWIYNQIKNYGIYPRTKGLTNFNGLGGGLYLDFVKLAGLQEELPDLTVKGGAFWTAEHIQDYEAKILQEKILGTGLKAGTFLRYEKRGEEHFYGIGPDTSLGDGTVYEIERTTLAGILGYDFTDTTRLEGRFAYQNVNIGNGRDGGRGAIDQIFVFTGRQQVPGLDGDEILKWILEFEHDNRDVKDAPTRGGYQRLHFSFNKGLESSTGYFKYRGEAAQFFKLFSDRRIFGLRGVVEHNDEVEGRTVPFFDMARLGGNGIYPRIGDVNRGFERDRFYDESLLLLNMEYRWAIWEYRDWRMDSVLLWDEGQTFGEWSDFQFKDFAGSYGLGFRVTYGEKAVLNIEVAKSKEGTEFYVNTKAPF